MFRSALGVAALAASALAESSCPNSVITTTTSYPYPDATGVYTTITPTDYVTLSTATPTVYNGTVTKTVTDTPQGVVTCGTSITKYVLHMCF